MPFCTLPLTPNGPLIDVVVMASRSLQTALQAAGKPVPEPVMARLLIDTGASHTCIDPSVLNKLNLSPRGMAAIHTPSTQGTACQVPQYDVGIVIPLGQPGRVQYFAAMPVIASSLSGQGIQGLLGRDILRQGLFTFNGAAGVHLLGF
jgi:hypothetical protein